MWCYVLQLLDCGLSDEQAEALATSGRAAHGNRKLTAEDVSVLMSVGLTEPQKKKLMATGMKAGMALGMKLFSNHVRQRYGPNRTVTMLCTHLMPMLPFDPLQRFMLVGCDKWCHSWRTR